jgi:hypothetical protein
MSTQAGLDPTLPESLWAATAPAAPEYPPLEGEKSAQLCIVGAGFTGLSAALHAAEGGVDVVLLEAAEPGWGAAGRNGGQVIPGLKLDPDDLEQRFGSERGQTLVEFIGSGRSSRALIRKGMLQFLVRTGSAGHVFTVLDEQNRKLTDAKLWLAGHEYEPDEDGYITVPFSNTTMRSAIRTVENRWLMSTAIFPSVSSENLSNT